MKGRATCRILAFAIALMPALACAFDAPPGQVKLTDRDILRGRFTQTHDASAAGDAAPPPISGHFTVVPSRGLIWGIELPFPTDTIVTAAGMKQNLGGLMIKVPARNLRHIYDMVGGALRGDWSALAQDFDMAVSGEAGHWSVTMTPKAGSNLPYGTITVTGGKFLQGIAVANSNGATDRFIFTGEVLSSAPPTPAEQALLDKGS